MSFEIMVFFFFFRYYYYGIGVREILKYFEMVYLVKGILR